MGSRADIAHQGVSIQSTWHALRFALAALNEEVDVQMYPTLLEQASNELQQLLEAEEYDGSYGDAAFEEALGLTVTVNHDWDEE